MTTRCHSLSFAVPLIITRHSLSFVVSRCTTCCHSLSLVVIRCATRLSFYQRSETIVLGKIGIRSKTRLLEKKNQIIISI